MTTAKKERAPRNRTVTLTEEERSELGKRCVQVTEPTTLELILNKTICQDSLEVIDKLPPDSVDLIFADPPYKLTKTFNGRTFSWKTLQDYEDYLEAWIPALVRVLKPRGSFYICGDWRSSSAIHRVAETYLNVQNRITWEREKGRGAKSNWKNSAEDIWFCTKSASYTFQVENVKLKRRVVAPYKDAKGKPKGWENTDTGNFRLTYPSNVWMDLTVPFWSMPENTDHPTQKPEKLVAKVILASSREGDVVLDPFLGSGTTSVVAKKLNRNYIGIEIDEMYAALAEKRLEMADNDESIQGYYENVFWERNTLALQMADENRMEKEAKKREVGRPSENVKAEEAPLFP